MAFAPEQLAQFVRQFKGKYSDDVIRERLIADGCTPAQAEQAFKDAGNILPAKSTPGPAEGSPAAAPASAQPASAPAEPPPAPEPPPDYASINRMILPGLAVLLVLGLGLGAALGLKTFINKTLPSMLGYGAPAADRAPVVQAAAPGLDAKALAQAAKKEAAEAEQAPDPAAVKTAEASAFQSLDELRGKLAAYAKAHDGNLPRTLNQLADSLPIIQLAPHPRQNTIAYYGKEACAGPAADPSKVNDSGGWAYAREGPCAGTIFIDCTHADASGKPRASW